MSNHTPTQQLILRVMQAMPYPMTHLEIMAEVNGHPVGIDRQLQRLVRDGSLIRSKIGRVQVFQLNPDPSPTTEELQ